MRTRGKRVTAECLVPRAVLREVTRVEPESIVYHWGVANVGAILSGANGAHSPNAIAAMFIRHRAGRGERRRGLRRHRLRRALAGEFSLAAAISSLEWVSAHEAYGRKR